MAKRKRSEKSEKESVPVPTQAPVSQPESVLRSEDSAFPRGGGSVLSALEIKRAVNEASQDVLFGREPETSKPNKKKTKKTKVSEPQEASVKIEGLAFSKLAVGSVVLGQVAHINALDLTIALPNNLVGYVPVSSFVSSKLEDDEDEEMDDKDEIPVSLDKLFSIGQWLRVVVTQTAQDKKHIELAVEPERVNEAIDDEDLVPGMALQGTVRSIEDHGVVVDVGRPDITGFITFKELALGGVEAEDVVDRQVLLFTVVARSSGRTLTLALSPLNVPVLESLTVPESSLVAGILVNALITDVRESGLVAKVFGFVDATADVVHSGLVDGTAASDKFKIGDKVKVRVLAKLSSRDNEPKLLVSTLPSVVGLDRASATSDEVVVGQILDVTVGRVDALQGFYVSIGSKHGFVHISRVSSEKRIEDLAQEPEFAIGSVHRARIVGHAAADNLYVMSTEADVLAQPFLRIEDVEVGAKIKGTVDRVLPQGGIVVNLAKGINGVVHDAHISDVKLANPERKFRPGAKVTVRVLQVDLARRRIRLTLKKSLVNSDERVVATLQDARAGLKTVCSVASLKSKGAVVEFFGTVRGFLPVGEITEAFITDPSERLRVGQSLSVTITNVDPARGSISVSCRSTGDSKKQAAALAKLSAGSSIVKATVVETSAAGLVVEIVPSGIRAYVPVAHLSDKAGAAAILKKMTVGQELEEAVVISINAERRLVTLSLKPSLIAAARAGTLPSSASDVVVGQTVAGYVKNATAIGVFVAFANEFVGLAARHELADKEVLDPASMFAVGASVEARVIAFDGDRIRLSLKSGPASSSGDIHPGQIVDAKIAAVKDTQLNVVVGSKQGRIDVSQLFDTYQEITDPQHPLQNFQKNQTVRAKIMGFHDARNHTFLPISHRSGVHTTLELSARPLDLAENSGAMLTLASVSVGDRLMVFVNNVTPDFVWASASPVVRGRISLLDLSADPSVLADEDSILERFPLGSALECIVVEVNVSTGLLRLSHRAVTGKAPASTDDVTVGDVLPAEIVRSNAAGLSVRLSSSLFASAAWPDVADEYTEDLFGAFAAKQIVASKVLSVSNGKVAVGLRQSLFDEAAEVVDTVINNASDLSAGQVVRGIVRNVADSGVFVSLGRTVTGRAQIRNLYDSFVADWKSQFVAPQLVEAKVLSVDRSGRVELSLKPSTVNGTAVEAGPKLADISEGDVLEGTVKRVETFGVFVSVTGTRLTGLCHKSQLADIELSDVSKVFTVGDLVKVKVLKVDTDTGKLSFGMKASYFDEEEDVEMDEYEEDGDEDNEDNGLEIGVESEEQEEDEEDEEEVEQDGKDRTALSAPFDWNASLEQQQVEDDSSDDEDRTKRRRKSKRTVEDQTAALSTRLPQSVADYERLVLGSPNSSVVWMNYMAFQVQLSELDKAREVAERALKTISFRDVEEKTNVWIALLNLENGFGTAESLDAAFKRAVQHNDPKAMHLKLANILRQSGKLDRAKQLYELVVRRKYSKNASDEHADLSEVWLEYANFLFDQCHDPEAGRALFDRALQALTPKQHRSIIPRFAQLEYQFGDAENARTIFEKLLAAYPTRTGLWHVYLDQEAKRADVQSKVYVQQLFERATSAPKLDARQAKQLFKKWLAFETRFGSTKDQDHVKAKATQFVQAST